MRFIIFNKLYKNKNDKSISYKHIPHTDATLLGDLQTGAVAGQSAFPVHCPEKLKYPYEPLLFSVIQTL